MGELIALDYGAARIGVARANTVAKIPEPLQALDATDENALKAVIEEHSPEVIIVGLPRNLHGGNTQQTHDVLDFKTKLEKLFDIPVMLQDEALTSVMAEERKLENESTDSVAAAIILEDYLRENKDQ